MANDQTIADEIKKDAGYAFNYIADVGNGQQFQITGSFPKDVDQKTVEKEFDKFRNVIEKHRTRSVIPNLEKGIGDLELKLAGFEDALKAIDASYAEKGADGKVRKLTSNDQMQRGNLAVNIKMGRDELDHKKKVLADAKKELE